MALRFSFQVTLLCVALVSTAMAGIRQGGGGYGGGAGGGSYGGGAGGGSYGGGAGGGSYGGGAGGGSYGGGAGGGSYGGGAGGGSGRPEPYDFAYDVKDDAGNTNFRKESGDASGAVKGSYGYTDVNGLYRIVEYIADAGGFRAHVKTNEPGTDNKSPADVTLEAQPAPAGAYRYTPRAPAGGSGGYGGGHQGGGHQGGYGGGAGAGGYGKGGAGAGGWN